MSAANFEDPTGGNDHSLSGKQSGRRKCRWARMIVWLAAAVCVLLLAIYFAGPPIAKSVLEKQLTKQLSSAGVRREAHVGKVKINPLALSAGIENFDITTSGGESLVKWRNLYVSMALSTLFTHEWHFRKIALDGFSGRIKLDKNGRMNFEDLLGSSPQEQASAQTQAPAKNVETGPGSVLRVDSLEVTDAQVDYADMSLRQPFETRIGPMSFTIANFQTGGPDQAPGEFSATTESGETLGWKGTISLAPFFSHGEVRLGNIPLKKYAPYYDPHVRFDVLEGAVDVIVRYEVGQSDRMFVARAGQSGVVLHNLKIGERGKTQPVVVINSLEINNVSVDSVSAVAKDEKVADVVSSGTTTKNTAAAVIVSGSAGASAITKLVQESPQARAGLEGQVVSIGRVEINGGVAAVKRDVQGFQMMELFTPAPSAVSGTTATVESGTMSAPVDVKVGELSIKNFAVIYDDSTFGTPLLATATLAAVSVKNFELNKLDKSLSMDADVQLDGGGSMQVSGEMAVSPLQANAKLAWTNLQLARASACLEEFAKIRVRRGVFSGSAQVALDAAGDIKASGDLSVLDFAVVAPESMEPMQSWKKFALSGVVFSSAPIPKVAINEIVLDGSRTDVSVLKSGKLNWPLATTGTEASQGKTVASGTATSASAEKTVSPAAKTESSFFATINKVTLSNGVVNFQDRSIDPIVKMTLSDINGTIAGLSSENLAHANVDLHAKINGEAPVALVGEINPLSNDMFTDVKLTLDGANLLPMGAYVGKYAGRELSGGTLNVDVHTRVSKRELTSDNVITLNKFELGAHTNSPDATSLPVGLAVSLLRDKDGKIVLDVPVKGSLDDPDFKYGRAVWRAIGNLLIKTATAPFSLLTSIVGGKGGSAGGNAAADNTDYSKVEFDAGAATPSAEGLRKLGLVAEMLKQRPELGVAVSGEFDKAGDTPGLAKRALERLLKREYVVQLGGAQAGAGQGAVAAANIEISPADEPRLVESLYKKRFGIATAPVVTGTTPTAGAAPAPAAEALPPLDQMKAKLLDTITVSDELLRALATSRAEAVRDYFVKQGGVQAERVIVSKEPAVGAGMRASLQLQ